MRDETLKILKKILNLPKKERQELLNILNTQPALPYTTSSSSRNSAKGSKFTVEYFKNKLEQSPKFMSVINQIHETKTSRPQSFME